MKTYNCFYFIKIIYSLDRVILRIIILKILKSRIKYLFQNWSLVELIAFLSFLFFFLSFLCFFPYSFALKTLFTLSLDFFDFLKSCTLDSFFASFDLNSPSKVIDVLQPNLRSFMDLTDLIFYFSLGLRKSVFLTGTFWKTKLILFL